MRMIRTMKSDFDPADYPRYEFRDGGVYVKVSGRRVRPQHNPHTNYDYYRLTDADSRRRCVSVAVADGLVEKVGKLYYAEAVPRRVSYREEYPAYAFANNTRRVYRIAFAQPRRNFCEVKPDACGRVPLLDYAGKRRLIPHSELF